MDLKESTQVCVNSIFPSSQDPSQVSKVALKIRSTWRLKCGVKAGVRRVRGSSLSRSFRRALSYLKTALNFSGMILYPYGLPPWGQSSRNQLRALASSSVAQNVAPVHQGCRFNPRSGHISGTTASECINKQKNKSMFLFPPPPTSPPLSTH